MARRCSNAECRAELPEDRKDRRCKDCERARSSARYSLQSEECRALKRVYYAANRETVKARTSLYYIEHREERCEQVSRWSKANPAKDKERHHRRRARKAGCVVSSADLRLVVEKAGGLCQVCGILIPEGLRHIDHIIPLSKGGPHAQENLQLLCRTCNCRKGARLPNEL